MKNIPKTIKTKKKEMPVTTENRFLLLYGSQTGQAKAIAEELAEKATERNLKPDIHCLSLSEKRFFLEREKFVVIVISTTGDGEPPDSALRFVRRLKKKTLPSDYLSHLNYTLLGLGDSNYTNFCNCGKTLDRRLQELGARKFYNCGWADDAVGLEVEVEPWMDGLWTPLKKLLHPSATNLTDQPSGDSCSKPDKSHDMSKSGEQTLSKNSVSYEIEISESSKDLNCIQTSNVCETNGIVDTAPTSKTHEVLTIETSPSVAGAVTNGCDSCDTNTGSALQNQSFENIVMGSNSVPSLRYSEPPLSESTLTVPALPQPFLKMEFNSKKSIEVRELPHQNSAALPSAATPVSMVTVSRIQTMTSEMAVKKAMLVELDISETALTYKPGDAISVITVNEETEVERLLARLESTEEADVFVELSLIEGAKKKKLPDYLPLMTTLRHILQTCVDIREAPKKALLRALVEHTNDESEKRRLQELCSKQGSDDYHRYLREPSVNIFDLLNTFTSCHPPVERLIEHLPRLQPRPYSVCCSPRTDPQHLQFCLTVVEIPPDTGRTYHRKGVCSGMLERIEYSLKEAYPSETDRQQNGEDLVQKVQRLRIQPVKIPIFARTHQSFHLPEDVSIPLILIGPGTGVAPFIGFLDERSSQRESTPDDQFGQIWLFYGCRHKDRDYLFREKLKHHVSDGTLTRLLVSFSRDKQPADGPRYVQDNIRAHGEELVKLISEEGAIVYVCGDAKNMAKDVNQAFVDIFAQVKGITADEATKLIMKLRLDHRYKEDVWT